MSTMNRTGAVRKLRDRAVHGFAVDGAGVSRISRES